MKLTIPRAALLELATNAAAVASPSKIVRNVRLDAEGLALCARATDYAMVYDGRRGARVEQRGGCLVNARHLRDIAGVLHDQDVSLTLEAGTLTLATGRRLFRLPTQDAGDFPAVQHAGGRRADLSAQSLAAAMRRTAYAQADVSQKPEYAALRIAARGGDVRAEATDCHRVAVDRRAAGGAGDDIDALAPDRWVETVLRSLGGAERASLTAADDRVTVDVGQDRWTSLCHRGKLPDLAAWTAALAPTCTVSVDRPALVNSLEATGLATSDNDLVVLTCDPPEGRVLLSATVLDAARAEDRAAHDELPATFDGDPPKVYGLNRRHMLDALRPLDCSKVTLRFSDELGPVIVLDPEDEAFCCAIAAVRVSMDEGKE